MAQGVARTSGIVRLTSPNVPLMLVGQDKMSDSHLSEKDTDVSKTYTVRGNATRSGKCLLLVHHQLLLPKCEPSQKRVKCKQ